MKRRLLIALAVLCTVALPLGCGVEETPEITTTTTESTTTVATTTTTDDETTERTTTTTEEEVTTTTTEEVTTTTASKLVTITKPKTTTTTAEETTTTAEETTTTAEETTTTAEEKTTTSSRRTVSVPSRTTSTTAHTPAVDIEDISHSIHNNAVNLGKIDSEFVRVTEFDPEWAFTHHPAGIVYFKGKYYTAFSRGYTGEDFPGQHMAMSVSEDFYHWSEPTVIFPATQGTYGETAIIPAGFYTFNGVLIANVYITDYQDPSYFNSDGSFNEKGSGKRETKIRQIYSTDGVTWSKPKNISSINTLSYPRQLSNGRWFSCTGKWIHYTDDEVPDGLKKWNWYTMPADMIANSQKRNGGKQLTEGSWYEGPDGVIHAMIRSDSGYLFHAASYDGGETLTEFYPTQFSSDNSQFNFWNLEDGRAIAIGSPNENKDIWDMWPLNLYVSLDGYNFNRVHTLRDEWYTIQKVGYSKGGQYAYMKMMEHDGYLYVFYSRMKEVMEVSRVKVSDIYG